MQRVTVTLDDDLMGEIDAIMAERGYRNRSEVIRDLARAGIREAAADAGQARECVAALVYVYDVEARELSNRLTRAYHSHQELSVASLQVNLGDDTCFEVAVLRGDSGELQRLGEQVIAERGVRHGKLVQIPLEMRRHTRVAARRTAPTPAKRTAR